MSYSKNKGIIYNISGKEIFAIQKHSKDFFRSFMRFVS